MVKKPKFLVKIEESVNDTHYVAVSWGGIAWGGTPSMNDTELKALADKINEYLESKKVD